MSKTEHIFILIGASCGMISWAFDLWFIVASHRQRRRMLRDFREQQQAASDLEKPTV